MTHLMCQERSGGVWRSIQRARRGQEAHPDNWEGSEAHPKVRKAHPEVR